MSDQVTCPHCGEISNIGGLIGTNTNDCPKCGKPVLENPLLEWQPLWDAMESNPNEWIPTTEKMYWDMLEVLPPRKMIGRNFLVGEALRDIDGIPVYSCFSKFGDTYKAKNLSVAQFLETFQ